ncbi:MAG: hypothetical protein SH818_12215 [Saprospiraceae bacterium]|nr:hypothetical protein [Saprospiraceae bacterium]
MEKKLPEDNLERFLRSSFEDYKQEPTDNVWGRIEAGLESNPGPSQKIKPWMYWSAAASVLGAIILFQFISNQSLNNKLEQVIQQNQLLSNQLPVEKTDSLAGSAISEPVAGPISNLKEGNLAASTMDSITSHNNETKGSDLRNNTIREKETSMLATENRLLSGDNTTISVDKLKSQKNKKELASGTSRTRNSSETSTIHSNAQIQGSEKASVNTRIKATGDQVIKQSSDKKVNPVEVVEAQKVKLLVDEHKLIRIDSSDIISGNHEVVKINQPARNIYSVAYLYKKTEAIESMQEDRFYYSGGLMHPIAVNSKSERSVASELSLLGGILNENGEITPKRLFDPRVNDFPKNEYTSSNSWQAGLEWNKPINRNFSVSGGIGVKHFEFINEFTQSLAFRNREQPSPGNQPFQHDFRCKLPGPSGTSDIIINSEQLDSRASISDAEQIKIAIKNQSRLNYLTLPLSMAFQVNKGRWSVFAKTGFQADIFLSRTVDEPQITLSHPQLKLRQDRPNKPKVNFKNSNPIILNAALSAGIKYQIGSLWSISLSPGLILPFSQRELNRDLQVDSKIYSVQFGLHYTLSSL